MEAFSPPSYAEPDTQRTLLENLSGTTQWDAAVDFLKKRFALYKAHGLRLNRLKPLADADIPEKLSLEKLYGSQATSVIELKTKLRSARTMCPYCSAPVEPDEIDHYLPQSKFPEYGIYSRNLVPCCGACNLKKTDKGYNVPKRMFLNPYLDAFLGKPFYHYNIVPAVNEGFEVPVFVVQFDHSLTTGEVLLCEAHFKALEIEQRSAKPLRQMITKWRQGFEPEVTRGELTQEKLRRRLARDYRGEIRTKEFNSLRAVLIRSVFRSPAIQDFICTKPIAVPA